MTHIEDDSDKHSRIQDKVRNYLQLPYCIKQIWSLLTKNFKLSFHFGELREHDLLALLYKVLTGTLFKQAWLKPVGWHGYIIGCKQEMIIEGLMRIQATCWNQGLYPRYPIIPRISSQMESFRCCKYIETPTIWLALFKWWNLLDIHAM